MEAAEQAWISGAPNQKETKKHDREIFIQWREKKSNVKSRSEAAVQGLGWEKPESKSSYAAGALPC